MLFNYIVQNVVTLLCITKMLYVHVMKSKVFIWAGEGGELGPLFLNILDRPLIT